ncbi:uncharacterized protein LOC130718038 [Lotus japonicus]|uniref:uncharacterized protein LOC130718038 n=1 Tax=Lotus japonicus TaxID=34305 RepID=UPI002588D9AD|nr:uncharacterized protein LOC130718038 [Lotus japonicus]
MGVFYHEEPQNHTKRCKFLGATLKEVFSHCQTFSRRLSTASLEEEFPMSDLDEEQEVIVSAVRSRAMEKQKQKPSPFRDGFSLVYSPATREFYVTKKMAPQASEGGDEEQDQSAGGDEEQDQSEEFLSVKSCFSCCSSREAFYSVKTNLSISSSMNELDFSGYWKRSIIQELCHCQGWPFGLCRKALLLPPLPKSPSESWLSSKIQPSTKVT